MVWLWGLGAAALAAGMLLAVGGCSPLTALNAAVPDTGYDHHADIAYGEMPRRRLDVYVPHDLAGPAPVVVFLYGGSWKRGERRNYRFVAETLTGRGAVVVIPDYRLYPEARFPGFVEDAAAAVRWVHDNIERYGGDRDRLFLMGHSAGAHIAALVALDDRYLAAVGLSPGVVRGLIGLAGPYAFDPSKYRSVRPVFADAVAPDDVRPVTFADGDAPPTLLLHGGDDTTVYPVNSAELARRINAAGGSARRIEYEDVGHVGILLALARPFRGRAPVADDAAAFIAGH